MNNLEKFNETVGILVNAYLNDTLMHGNCYACAVGNIVAAKKGYTYGYNNGAFMNPSWNGQPYPALVMVKGAQVARGWGALFTTSNWTGKQRIKYENIDNKYVKDQIEATGYNWSDLAKIEYAFEVAEFGDSIESHMFNGLMAVVDVLAEIHNIDLSVKEQAKLLFTK